MNGIDPSFSYIGNTPNSKSYFKDVIAFHRHYGLLEKDKPQSLDEENFKFRCICLHEELEEFKKAYENKDLPEMVDAIQDLIWFAFGTLDTMGIKPHLYDLCWNEVKRANMSKVRTNDPNKSKRGSSLDITKPEGWVGPQTREFFEMTEDEQLNLF